MSKDSNQVGFFHSLRTQLWLGALLLLGMTVSTISYFLIVNVEKTLTRELEKSVVLLGRNVALSSQRALRRADPELELFPLVKRFMEDQDAIISVTVTDDDGLIQGDRDIANVGKPFHPELSGHVRAFTNIGHVSRAGEELYVDEVSYVLRTPVLRHGKSIGDVYLTYSKQELRDDIAEGVRITITVSAAALILALLFALVFSRRISRPMKTMMEGVATLAGGNFDAKLPTSSKNEFGVLANAFNDMAFRIAAAQQDHIVRERMDRELEIARDIQHTLMPHDVSPPENYEIARHYASAMEVGGDYLDIVSAGESQVVLVMADVSGKGVPGLVVMAMIKIMVQDLVAKGATPMEIVRKLNSALLGNIRRNMFVTCFVAILDGDTGTIVFSNAGHNPVLLYDHKTQRARFFKMEGPPLATFPDEVFGEHLHEYRVVLSPGDMLLQYTDGLNESMNDIGEQFTLDRVLGIANKHGHRGAMSLVGHLVRAEAAFRGSAPQSDDLTLMAVSAAPGGSKRRPLVKEEAELEQQCGYESLIST
jgi:serine phosphatase RsbU (regulator of sigma subunit)